MQADLLIRGGKVADLQRMRLRSQDVVINGAQITAVVAANSRIDARRTVDASGKIVAPGLVDAHLHIESTMLSPAEFARVAVARGTTGVFVDPHEIANVIGAAGVRLFLEEARHAPLDLAVGIPSCVPATAFEDAGGELPAGQVAALLKEPGVYGLAEMMDSPGVIHGNGEAREKVALAFDAGRVVDGHAPGVTGPQLRRYIAGGLDDGMVRIMSDHESTNAQEALEKHSLGMTIALRYGSASRDLDEILPGVLAAKAPLKRFMLCTDDVDIHDLLTHGHMDHVVRRVARILEAHGRRPVDAALTALSLASARPGEYFRPYYAAHNLAPAGLVAPGYRANLVVFEDLRQLAVDTVVHAGHVNVVAGRLVTPSRTSTYGDALRTVHLRSQPRGSQFRVVAPQPQQATIRTRVIVAKAGSLITTAAWRDLPVSNGSVVADPGQEVVKLAVVERHRSTGLRAIGFVEGLGIQRGALASTVAHDSHNLIVAGADDAAMARAATAVAQAQGGIAVVVGSNQAVLPLPLAGLMSIAPAVEDDRQFTAVIELLRTTGSEVPSLPMLLSFLALPVSPHLKLTNRGLVDVDAFAFVPLLAD